MSTQDTLIQVRLDKHSEANGKTYPLAKESTHIRHVLSLFTEKTPVSINPDELDKKVSICGRVSLFRKSGSITFLKIVDSTGSIQIIVSKSSFNDYQNLKLIDLGDIVQITGKLCLSKTNEPSILLLDWTLLTKAHKPPPEKFAGLSDIETKYRKRYLDLLSSEESRAVFTVRSYLIKAIRQFMEISGFLEVETSTLNTVNSGANAKPFITHHNALDMHLYLRIAPELYLKRLLVGGMDRVFEIGRNYRNEGLSTRHNPEFTMLEFYEAYGNFDRLFVYAERLFRSIDINLNMSLPDNIKPYYLDWKENRTFTFEHAVKISMLEAVQKAGLKRGLSIVMTSTNLKVEELNTPSERKFPLTYMWGQVDQCTSTGQIISTLFEHLAEPYLTEDYRSPDGKHSVPVYITDYPKDICPLARAKDDNPFFCDRFELFIDGRELANAFQELNDPAEQSAKFKEQLASNDKDPMDYDADYVEALEYGMPPAIGFGMGIDRLVQLITNKSSIRDVILFPTLKLER